MNRHVLAITGMVVFACLAAGALWVSGLAAQPPQEPDPERLRPDHYSFSDAALRPYLAASPDVPEALPAPSAPVDNWSKAVYEIYIDNWEIALYDLDGSYWSFIASNESHDIHPHLSRGSGLVTFASRRNGNYDIFSVHSDGTGLTQITSSGADEVYPTWSPDGTRILYQSYVNGNPDIYVMNADGSGQAPLTLDPDYDGMPSWAPDGTRLTFVSRRTGGYRVYTMNADGSNLLQINNQPYSADPHWSPDGSKILYDADSDGDGWQELWVMNADGSGQQLVEDASQFSSTDAWAGSWAPDSIHISYTRVHFVWYNGQWYWDWGRIVRGTTGGYEGLIISGNTNWNADWQTEDYQAPVSAMNPAPPISAYRIPLSWAGYDLGAAGLMNYDVQVRVGSSGSWANWLAGTTSTSGYYSGVGGQTYYFRARSRDNSWNVEAWSADAETSTWVENYPPTSRVGSLPAFSRSPVLVAWAGYDSGGSDPLTYDIQYRDASGGGSWINWLTNTSLTSQSFNGTPGTSYCFRSRARDMAQNYEAWPAGDGDACTSIFEWMISGNAHDTRGGTVISATASLAGGEVGSLPSNTDGYYAAYGAGETNYQVSWAKAGYQPLPATTFPSVEDVWADIFLPPADNQVSNWGFESLLQDWQLAGALLPVAVPEALHTGGNGVFMGSTAVQFTPPIEFTDMTYHTGLRGFEIDSSGGLHLLWSRLSDPNKIQYAYRDPSGAWQPPETITTAGYLDGDAFLVTTPDDVPHALWDGEGSLYHRYRNGPSSWSDPVNISYPYVVSLTPRVALDPNTGIIHVAWVCYEIGSGYGVCYTQRDISGSWQEPVVVIDPSSHMVIYELIHNGEQLHILYISDYSIYYSRRNPDGTWLPAESPCSSCESYGTMDMAVGSEGEVHLALGIYNRQTGHWELIYTHRREDTGWTSTQVIATDAWSPHLELDLNGVAHLIWNFNTSPGIYYSWRSQDGSWSEPFNIYPLNTAANSLFIDSQNGVHLLAGESYTRRMADGDWSPLIPFRDGALEQIFFRPRVDQNGILHVPYQEGDAYGSRLRFTSTEPATATGLFSLSQALTVPVSLTHPSLSFLYQGGGYAPFGEGYLLAEIDDGVSQNQVYTVTQGTAGWEHAWADLSPWAGQAVTLTVGLNQAEGYAPAWAYLDEVTLGSAYPDVSTALQGVPMSVLPGDQFTFQLGYANPGGVLAEGSVLTMTLPLGLDFIAASQPPAQAGSDLVWVLGDLPGQTPMQTISVTVQVNAQAVIGSQLLTLARISTLTPELETANNTASSAIYVGVQVYLPVLRK